MSDLKEFKDKLDDVYKELCELDDIWGNIIMKDKSKVDLEIIEYSYPFEESFDEGLIWKIKKWKEKIEEEI